MRRQQGVAQRAWRRCPRVARRPAARSCRSAWPSSRRPSGGGRSAARCARTAGRWPPPTGRSRPRDAGRPGRRRRCGCRSWTQVAHAHGRALDVPARPTLAQRRSTSSARPAWRPSRARSRGHRPCRTRRPRPARRPAAGRDRGAPAGRRPARRRCGRRSSRRRCDRRGPCSRSVSMSVTMSVDVLGGPRQDVRRGDAQPREVLEERGRVARGQLGDGDALRGGVADDLVVDVGDVHDPRHRVALPVEVAAHEVGEHEAPEVAHVGGRVHGRPAGVHPRRARASSGSNGSSSPPSVLRNRSVMRARPRRAPWR